MLMQIIHLRTLSKHSDMTQAILGQMPPTSEDGRCLWREMLVPVEALGRRLVTACFKLDHLDDAIIQVQLVFRADVADCRAVSSC